MQFNPEQLEALSLDRHLAVTANAGSGKTGVLTERFVRILLETDADLRSVVAITFTTMAAAEMRRKVRERLLRADGTPAQRERIASFIRRIGSARISTIHAFCAAVLRRYDTDSNAGDAREISGAESAALLRDATMRSLRTWLTSSDERRTRALAVFDVLPTQSIESILYAWTGGAERRHRLQEWFNAFPSMQALEASRHAACARIIRTMLHAYVGTLLDTVIEQLPEEPGADARAFRTALQSLHERIDASSADEIFDVAFAVHDVLKPFVTTEGRLKRTSAWLKAIRHDADTSAWPLLVGMHASGRNNGDAQQCALIRTLVDMAADAAQIYDEAKRQRGGMDFDDMMLRTRDLLQRPSIAEEIRRDIRYIMVDEFQDTNPLQYDVLRSLVPDLEEHPTSSTCPNLFLVGDAKQSIYGFRDADVRVFARACADVERANLRNGHRSGSITLQSSYRMLPAVADAVNTICTACFTTTSDYDVAYEPLVAARSPDAVSGVGSMHLLLTDTDGDDAEADAEAVHVRNLISSILASGHANIRGTAGDIAVLTRTSTFFEKLAQALRASNIPYQVHGGRAFFSRPEVADIRNLLRVATDPTDDLALAALLRSPLLRWTDRDIYEAACRTTASLYDGIDDARTVEFLDFCKERVHLMMPTDFVRTALERSRWYAAIAAEPRRDQIISNVNKVIDIIRAEQQRGAPTLHDVMAALAVPTETDTEAEGSFGTDPNAVQIMTLHAAKGLEFPIVILAGIAGKGGSSPTTLWSDALGPSLSLPAMAFHEGPPPTVDSEPTNLVHTLNAMYRERREMAEDRRLLYVGLTRAKDHCVISLPYSLKRDGTLKASYGIGKLLTTMLDDAGVQCATARHGDVVLSGITVLRGVPHTTWSNVEDMDATKVIDLSSPLRELPSIDVFYVTDLLDQRILEDHATDVDDENKGAAYGTLVHAMLQRTLSAVAQGDAPDDAFRAMRRDMVSVPSAWEHAEREVRSVLRTRFVREHAALLTSAFFERTLAAHANGTILLGTMDVCSDPAQDTMEVWDWKTTSFASDLARSEAVLAYRVQLGTYAWMCFQAYPNVERIIGRLLFTRYASDDDATWVNAMQWTRAEMPELFEEIRNAMQHTITRRMQRSGMM